MSGITESSSLTMLWTAVAMSLVISECGMGNPQLINRKQPTTHSKFQQIFCVFTAFGTALACEPGQDVQKICLPLGKASWARQLG